MKDPDHLPPDEVAHLLLRIVNGETSFETDVLDYDCCVHYHFTVEGYQIVFFIDAGELDYCDQAIAPDGREGTFDSWYNFLNPLSYLDRPQRDALKSIFQEESARLHREKFPEEYTPKRIRQRKWESIRIVLSDIRAIVTLLFTGKER